jgi:hypothetical protein
MVIDKRRRVRLGGWSVQKLFVCFVCKKLFVVCVQKGLLSLTFLTFNQFIIESPGAPTRRYNPE